MKKLLVVTMQVAGAFGCCARIDARHGKSREEQLRGIIYLISDIRKTMKPCRPDLLGFETKIPIAC